MSSDSRNHANLTLDVTETPFQPINFICRKMKDHKGLLIALLSAFLYSLSAMFAKIGGVNISPLQLVVIRSLFSAGLAPPVCVYLKTPMSFTKREWIILLISSVISTAATLTMFAAYSKMPLGDANAIIYSFPIFSGIFGWLLVKEKLHMCDVIFIAGTLVGVVLVSRPPFLFGSGDADLGTSRTHFVGSIFAFMCAVSSGTGLAVVRMLGSKTISPFVMITGVGVLGIVIPASMLSVLSLWQVPHCGLERNSLVAMAMLGFIGILCLYLALMHENTVSVAIVATNDVFFSFLIQYFVWGIVPSLLTVVGVTCIFGFTVAIHVRKLRRQNLDVPVTLACGHQS